MDMDWSSLHKAMRDSTRRSIVELLSERQTLNYTDIMTVLGVTNTGRLNYHLKALGDLISKNSEGGYQLTDKGRAAANLLRTFPERAPNGSSPLRTLVYLVLTIVGGAVVASIAGLTIFFLAVGAGLSGFFVLLLATLCGLGVAMVILGILTRKSRILQSL
jgi:predicted transcriptional regulator